jgi:3',5'-cyclic AMP phosphodiesterase CpdA
MVIIGTVLLLPYWSKEDRPYLRYLMMERSMGMSIDVYGKNPNLVFPVISDVHINSEYDNTLEKFITTLEQLNLVAPKQDAFVVVGDLTDSGLTVEYDKFFTAYNARKQSQVVSLFAIGNHDYWNGLSDIDAQKLFLVKTGMESLYYRKVINGYHFIILGTEDGVTEGTFTREQIKWLAEQLKQANDDDPKKPIFVFHHQPMKDTIYGSEWGFSNNRDLFYDTLKEYPQVISFSGHTHYPLSEPRIIQQKDFTSIGTSTGAYMCLEDGKIQFDIPEGAFFLNQALIVEVYDDKLLMKRRDIHNNDWTGEPFEITLPATKSTFTYTDSRDITPPYFTEDATIACVTEQISNSSITVTFSQALDNLLVHEYKIKVINGETGEIEKEILAFSEFYRDPKPNAITLKIEGLKSDTLYEIKVYAIDSFGNESNNNLKVLGKTSR